MYFIPCIGRYALLLLMAKVRQAFRYIFFVEKTKKDVTLILNAGCKVIKKFV